jgi:hypothetical protein
MLNKKYSASEKRYRRTLIEDRPRLAVIFLAI